MRRKKSRLYMNVKEIPEAINEIVSYLSMDFSKNKLFERDDLVQDLYTLYLTDIHNHPDYRFQLPGWWFIRLKWYLLTVWRKRVSQINREWDYKLTLGVDPNSDVQNYKSEEVLPKDKAKKKKKGKYCF